jgi:hypothetical protein
MDDKYSHFDEMTAFGFLMNALDGGGDRDRAFPYSDMEDMSHGLRFIPGEVTVARRQGQVVSFNQPCEHQCCWYWQYPNGTRHYYWDRADYQGIAARNGKDPGEDGRYADGAGACPDCGNEHTKGGYVKMEAAKHE